VKSGTGYALEKGCYSVVALHAVARVTEKPVEPEEKNSASVRNTRGVTLRESKENLIRHLFGNC
jgi:hypothetical protein